MSGFSFNGFLARLQGYSQGPADDTGDGDHDGANGHANGCGEPDDEPAFGDDLEAAIASVKRVPAAHTAQNGSKVAAAQGSMLGRFLGKTNGKEQEHVAGRTPEVNLVAIGRAV